MKPLVSVLIPTYNVLLYVEEAVNSILHQTYQNIEIIIVDDCSTDGTYERLVQLKEKDTRIKLYRNKQNSKIAETLNFAYSVSSGEFIARMDGDDISLPTRIEEQLTFLLKNPAIDLVGLNVLVINEDGGYVKDLKFSTSADTCKRLLPYFSPVPHFWLAKRETYEKVGKYRIATVEDYDFLLRMDSIGLKYCNHPNQLYKQRIRNGNTTTSSGLIQRKLVDYILYLYKERSTTGNFVDSHTDDRLEIISASRNIEKFWFGISNRFMYKFSLTIKRNKVKSAVFFGLAVILSPLHQGRYFIKKYKYNRILNNNL